MSMYRNFFLVIPKTHLYLSSGKKVRIGAKIERGRKFGYSDSNNQNRKPISLKASVCEERSLFPSSPEELWEKRRR